MGKRFEEDVEGKEIVEFEENEMYAMNVDADDARISIGYVNARSFVWDVRNECGSGVERQRVSPDLPKNGRQTHVSNLTTPSDHGANGKNVGGYRC